MSRQKAIRSFRGEKVKEDLRKNRIYVKAVSNKGIAEEAPGAYKNIDEVIDVTQNAGLAQLVAKVIPLGVMKG